VIRSDRTTAATCAALCALALVAPDRARAARVHVIKQVTNITQGNLWQPNIRQGNGEFLSFVSDGDVLGPGTAHLGRREIYLWSLEDDGIVRLTNSAPGESYDSSRMSDDFRSKRSPMVAFVSTGDLDPSVGNADGNPEIFVWLRAGGIIKQLTDTVAPVVNAQPFPSDSGDCLIFQSTGDLDDNPGSFNSAPTYFTNEDGSPEVFYIDFHDNEFGEWHTTQISDGPPGTTSELGSAGGYFFPNQCANITYQSDYDQLGNGSNGTNVYDHRKSSALRDQPSEPGNLGGLSIEPRMSGTGVSSGGPSVVFASDVDLRGQGKTGFHIYKFPVHTGILRRLTGNPGGGHRNPKVSDGSTVVIFETTGEPIDNRKPSKRGPDGPHNADGNSEIYRLVGKNVVRPITRTTGCTNDHSSIMGNGRGIGFRSDCDLISGHNPLGLPQAFVYYEVHRGEPLSTAAQCSIAAGCCSTANGCYEEIIGRNYR
jgi:hypothetical protein